MSLSKVENDKLERLRAMTEDKGETWDLSPNDKQAIAYAVRSIELLDSAHELLETIENDTGIVPQWLWSKIEDLISEIRMAS